MAEPITLRAAAKNRVWALVARRRKHSTPEVFAAYLDHARKLPHWLRHNGLALALEYLGFVSTERKDAIREGATALLADWGAELGTGQGLHLAKVLDAKVDPAPPADASEAVARKRLIDRLARREAELFKRYAEALDPDKKDTTIEMQPEMAIADQPPPWQVPAPRLRNGHPGLLWRYAGAIKGDNKLFRKTHIDALLQNAANGSFKAAFTHYGTSFLRRRRWIESHAAICEVELRSRLFIDLGNRGVFETQCSMHPITGMPVIAASAQKSLLRRYVDHKIANMPEELRKPMRDWIAEQIGTPEVEGRLCVHDAWWVPGSATIPWVGDIDTVHHPRYYRGQQDDAPTTDSPEPNPQIGVVGSFLLAVGHTAEDAGPAGHILSWLAEALDEIGIGARLRTGAGRFGVSTDRLHVGSTRRTEAFGMTRRGL